MGHEIRSTVDSATKSTQEQLDFLKEHLEQFLKDRITPALQDAADKADSAVATAREVRDEKVARVSTSVRSQPIAAIIISSVVGFIAGRLSK